MVVERGFERMVKQVLHGKRLREVTARRLPRARSVVEVNDSGAYDDVVASRRGDIVALRVEGEVGRSNREARLEQAFVDRPELANREAAEVDRPRHAVGLVNKHRDERRSELSVR